MISDNYMKRTLPEVIQVTRPNGFLADLLQMRNCRGHTNNAI